ncbi:hypothetical protein F7887_04735 [Bacteroides fragilis]|nr:hypothetical protein F7887_04735 [Bacteroides fragilis]RHH70822.1 hypothetical protein DW198_03945 [Bacteroides fragilis]
MKLPNYLQKKNLIIFDRYIVFLCLFVDNQWYMFFLRFVRDMNFFFFEIGVFDCLFTLFS